MSIYDYEAKQRDWNQISLSYFKWKVLIIVNTATWCWFTPQYEWLENLYKKYHDKWLEILDFPCDQFSKIEVNGDNEHPLYTYLKQEQPKEEVVWLKNKAAMTAIKAISATCKKDWDIVWNFTKFLVDKDWM